MLTVNGTKTSEDLHSGCPELGSHLNLGGSFRLEGSLRFRVSFRLGGHSDLEGVTQIWGGSFSCGGEMFVCLAYQNNTI